MKHEPDPAGALEGSEPETDADRPPPRPILPPRLAIDSEDVVTPADITMIICIRAHEDNPWVLDRLALIHEYYDPLPRILIVDFGSIGSFRSAIEAECDRLGYDHIYVDDHGTFSLAISRNRGFEHCGTELVFFCDIDCFGIADLFARLANIATGLRLKTVIDVPLILPAYHMNEADTAAFLNLEGNQQKSRYLEEYYYYSSIAAFDRKSEVFTAPYSNVFLINRRNFSIVGGYDERFRGHGSEDFEFLTRLAHYVCNAPLPKDLADDRFGPLRDAFFEARPYAGFRRLIELLSKPAENFGLRICHQFHPRPAESKWVAENDWKSERLLEAFDTYIGASHRLLSIDFLKRNETISCLCRHHGQWGYFTPLREAGYQLRPAFDDLPETIASITDGLISGELAGVAIFNPYMASHSQYSQLIMLARELGREVIVIERGALPGTIYYDEDVAYNSPNFTEEAFKSGEFTDRELARADGFIADLVRGSSTLEQMDGYKETAERYSAVSRLQRRKCFVPLQLEEDMAVTMFLKGEQSYPEFVLSLPKAIEKNPDILFIVKPHPLSKLDDLFHKPNLIVARREDNIHFLLDIADFTICYNSGVGLLSLIHGKRTITVGNAYYNICGVGHRAASLEVAIGQSDEIAPPDPGLTRRIVAWLLFRRYSNFVASDQISESATRKAHNYKDILVTHLRWKDLDIALGRQREIAKFSKRSYLWAQIADASRVQSVQEFVKWAHKHYERRDYERAATDFRRAFCYDPSKPNLLRFAAEAYLKAGRRKDAIEALAEARTHLPRNKRLYRRYLVVKYPILGIFGRYEAKVG